MLTLPDITLVSPKGYKSLEIVVEQLDTFLVSERNLTTSQLIHDHIYVTAALPVDYIPETFTIGDNLTYGGYRNKPLKTGVYAFYLGFNSWTEQQTNYILFPGSKVELGQ